MSEQRLIDANNLGVGKANPDVFERKDYAYGWNSALQAVTNAAPTIDPETLPIVQGLRTYLAAIKGAYNVAGHRPLLTQAIERFGQEAQERMMFEEMSELQKAICKLSRGKGSIDDIAQEIADVEIMLEQMKILYQCEESAAL